jgi:hypothetical protein
MKYVKGRRLFRYASSLCKDLNYLLYVYYSRISSTIPPAGHRLLLRRGVCADGTPYRGGAAALSGWTLQR